MASVQILINSGASPNLDIAYGSTVSLSNADNAGATDWQWMIVDRPTGSTASLSTPASATTTFVADKEGTYLIRLTINNTFSDTTTVSVRNLLTGHRLPSFKERLESNTRGWTDAINSAIYDFDSELRRASTLTCRIANNLPANAFVKMAGIHTLANGQTIPIVDVINPATDEGASILGVTTASALQNSLAPIQTHGPFALTLNTSASSAGAPVYLADDSSLSLTPGTNSIQVGMVMDVAASGHVFLLNRSIHFNGDLSIEPVGNTPNAAAATLVDNALTIQPASTTHPGVMTSTDKTNLDANTAARHAAVTLGTANGLDLSGQQLSLSEATNSTPGAATAAQISALEAATAAQHAAVTLTAVGASPAAEGASLSGQALTLQPASTSHPGVMTATDKTNLDANTTARHDAVTLTAVGSTPAAEGASLSGQAVTLQPASASHPGVMVAADKVLLDSLRNLGTFVAAGSDQASATPLTAAYSIIDTGGTTTNGVRLPAPITGQSRKITVVNVSGGSRRLYPHSGGKIDFSATNGFINITNSYAYTLELGSDNVWRSATFLPASSNGLSQLSGGQLIMALAGPSTTGAMHSSFYNQLQDHAFQLNRLVTLELNLKGGETSQGAANIVSGYVFVTGAENTSHGVTLPDQAALVDGCVCTVYNNTGSSKKVWPHSGGSIDGLSTNTSCGLPDATAYTFIRWPNTNKWVSVPHIIDNSNGLIKLPGGILTLNLATNASPGAASATQIELLEALDQLSSYNSSVAAAGTDQASATWLPAGYNNVTSGAGGGVKLPTATSMHGQIVAIRNITGGSISVYPGGGGSIDTLSSNTPFTLTNGSSCLLVRVPALGYWKSINLSATQSNGLSRADGTGNLSLAAASAGSDGAVTTGNQTFAGAKTFSGAGVFSSTLGVSGVLTASSTAGNVVAAEAWQNLSLVTNWVTAVSGRTPKFRKEPDGTVWVRGEVRKTSNGIAATDIISGDYLGTLPTGYVPPLNCGFVVAGARGGAGRVIWGHVMGTGDANPGRIYIWGWETSASAPDEIWLDIRVPTGTY